MLLRLIPILALWACTCFAEAAPADPKTGLALELMDVMHMDATIRSVQGQVLGFLQNQFASGSGCAAAEPIVREFSTKVSDELLDVLESDDFKVDVAAVYADVFSQAELQGIIDFYHTALGQKMLAHMPELMQKSLSITQARMKTLQPQLEALTSSYGQRIRDASASCATAGSVGVTKH